MRYLDSEKITFSGTLGLEVRSESINVSFHKHFAVRSLDFDGLSFIIEIAFNVNME